MIAINNQGKRRFVFLGSETQKMINCEHVIFQRVVSRFFQVNNKCNQDCTNYVSNISGEMRIQGRG